MGATRAGNSVSGRLLQCSFLSPRIPSRTCWGWEEGRLGSSAGPAGWVVGCGLLGLSVTHKVALSRPLAQRKYQQHLRLALLLASL